MDAIQVLDTTLRDGSQSRGVYFSVQDRSFIARQLEKAGVDIIEIGFPTRERKLLPDLQEVAGQLQHATVCALARCHPGDIDAAWEAIRPARYGRLHVFIATSPAHLRHKLGMTEEQVLVRVEEGVRYARQYCSEVQFSAEDATRSETEFLTEVIRTAINAGAGIINLPDTAGVTEPDHFSQFLKGLKKSDLKEAWRRTTFSVHCHNDRELAVANTLAAVRQGVRQVECTVNGLGERTGNANLVSVVCNLEKAGFRHHVRLHEMYPTSVKVAQRTRAVPVNQPFVGRDAYTHVAGIHQQYPQGYEGNFRPSELGMPQGSQIVITVQAGRKGLAQRLRSLKIYPDRLDLDRAYQECLKLARDVNEVSDRQLEEIARRCFRPDYTVVG
jgi:2-isopropylmalate synthase